MSLRAALSSVLFVAISGCGAADRSESGWQLTVYYTAVESLHNDERIPVRGCLEVQCSRGDDVLGQYPSGFVQAVEAEGTGRITSGPEAGRYLNWASTEGFWLDDAPRDAAGRPLEPFRSAAADGVLEGTSVKILNCGRGYDGGPPSPEICETLAAGRWEIRDEFTPGLGGKRHIDLYLGEENAPDFTQSPMYTTFEEATLQFGDQIKAGQ